MARFARLFPTAPIGAYLIALVVGVALPLLVFGAFLMLQLEEHERDMLSSNTAEDAQMIARAVDRELQDMATTLRLLVSSPELESGDLRAFHERTRSSLRSTKLFVIVADRDGHPRPLRYAARQDRQHASARIHAAQRLDGSLQHVSRHDQRKVGLQRRDAAV